MSLERLPVSAPKILTPEIRQAVILAFLEAFRGAHSSDLRLSGFSILMVSWYDPQRGCDAPRTFDVLRTANGYTFEEH
jgi:hypothetical protein